MKKIFHKIGLACLAIIAFSACSQIDYEGEYSKEGYFTGDNKVAFVFRTPNDTAQHYSFGLKSTDTLTHKSYLRIFLVGYKSPTDRTFKIVADASSTAQAGVHYTALPETYTLPADSSRVYIPIELIRANIGSTGLDTLTLVLNLVPTDDLKTNITQYNRLGEYDPYYVYTNQVKITFDNTTHAPDYWIFFQANWGLAPFTLQRYLALQQALNNKAEEVIAKANGGDYNAMMELYQAILVANQY